MEQQNKTHHLVLIPTPGMGHLIPLVELAKRILNVHPFTISFLILHEGSQTRTESVLGALPEGRVNSYFLPPVNLDDISKDSKIETRISLALARSQPAIRDHLKTLQAMPHIHLAAIIVDLFGTDVFDVAFEFNMKSYMFVPSNAMFISFMLHLPKLDSQVTSEYRDMDDPIKFPGCVTLRGKDLVDPAQDRTNDAYKWVLHHAKKYKLAEGIMVNSFNELEKETLNVLQNPEPGFPPVYPIGPMIRTGGSDSDPVDGSGCLTWLDQQPRGSVLFVSFGSGGTLSYDQLNELAYGLEISEQRFLWVVRPPNNKIANGAYFSNEVERDPLHFLPKGFLERTKSRGLVVRDWAPQVQVLNHESTGGFICHCGWNSVLESVVHGVPLIAWPLYAEQRMNAVMLVEGLKIALRPKTSEETVIGRVAIATAVKGLMEGEEGKQIRYKMNELKDASSRVLSVEGSSTKALMEVARKWTSH